MYKFLYICICIISENVLCILWNKENEYLCDNFILTFPSYVCCEVTEMSKPSSQNVFLKCC